MKKRKVIGLARTIDIDESGICRVRMFDKNNVPTGKVLTGVRFLPDAPPVTLAQPLPELSQIELDSITWQNVLYNSHQPVVVE